MHAELRLRASETDDEAFLRRVYAGTRTHEIALAGWDAVGADAFLRMQFDAQQRHYRAYYPQVRFDIVERAGEAIGRLYVARHADAIHVLDIALLAPWHGQGIGAALLRVLQEEAAREGRRLTLQVALNNRAHALYARLGFTNTALQGLHQAMEWRAPSTA